MSELKTDFNQMPCGLVNEGSVCYVNSLLQQFYNFKEFRRLILDLDEMKCVKEPLLDSLKRLFYDLSIHEEDTVEIEYFIENWNDFSRYYIDYDEQRDITEFLRWFFIHLLQAFQRIDMEQSIKDLFCSEVMNSTTINQNNKVMDEFIQSSLVLSTIERKDQINYMMLNIGIGDNTLYDSLRDYIKIENIDFNWSIKDHDKKVSYPSYKQTSILSLGKYLIIQLKRFEFNTKKCKVMKKNERLEFPLELDMSSIVTSQQVVESSNDGDDQHTIIMYNLRGVVIHQGKANKGHYYSLCRDEDSNTWYQLDDEDVSEFDINTLSEFAFGGKDLEEEYMEKGNAFLLFYQRRESN